jgi:hypothetical protein
VNIRMTDELRGELQRLAEANKRTLSDFWQRRSLVREAGEALRRRVAKETRLAASRPSGISGSGWQLPPTRRVEVSAPLRATSANCPSLP